LPSSFTASLNASTSDRALSLNCRSGASGLLVVAQEHHDCRRSGAAKSRATQPRRAGTREATMEAADVSLRCNAMWAKLGRMFERHAYERAKLDNSLDREVAIGFAKAAEGCFWQSTGESDAFDLKRD
jgi:hypothetical protein